jgi:predicted HicB family RNase H-like nuclease
MDPKSSVKVFRGVHRLGPRCSEPSPGCASQKLEKAFRDSVDDYLDFCAERGEEPDKPFSGRFMLERA